MDSEEKDLLKKSIEIAEDNNKILHSIVRYMHVSRIMTFVYWIFIVGSAVGAFYFIQPYLGELYGFFGGAKIDSINNMFQDIKR